MGLRAALPRDGAAMLQTLLNEQAGRQQPSKGAQNVLTLRTALLGNHFDHDWDQRIALHA
jgi:hypothetical protein